MTGILETYEADPKVTVYSIKKGIEGFATAQSFFFPSDISNGMQWAKQWSDSEKKGALFFLYVRKKRVGGVLGFKVVLGEGDRQAVLGEERPFEEGLQIWSGYLSADIK